MICKICKKQFEIKSIHCPHQMYCSHKCGTKAYRIRNKIRLNKKSLEDYHRKRENLVFPISNCLYCGKPIISKTLKSRKFCSNKCLKNNWAKTNKVYMRKIVKRWYHDNLEHARELGRKYANKRYNRCRESILHNAHIQNSKRKGAIGSHTMKEWKDLKARHNFTCLHCGRKEPEIKLTRDHILAISKGGTNFIDNIQPLCLSCNCSKGNRLNCQRAL